MNHFEGKDPLAHVIEARKKGKLAASEIHGEELSGHISAAADSAKETVVLLVLLLTLFDEPHLLVLVFLLSWLIWKTSRSAILGYRRLERLHRLIEEERWEIEHHRAQEKDELRALYEAKGFSGKLLEEVVDVLMADDNRLLQVMLEEELGLSLETYEHPLKQAMGAFLGVLGATALLSAGLFLFPYWGDLGAAALIVSLSAGFTAKLERNRVIPAIAWNLAAAGLTVACAHFLRLLF